MGRPDRKTGFREWQVRTAARCAFLNLSRIMAALPFGPLPKAEKAMFINSLRNKLWKWLCCTCLPWTKKSWGIHHFCTLSWKVKVAQLCPTLCNYTVHGILQARILEWVAFPFSRGSSQPRDQTQVSHIAGGLFTSWATREAIVTSKTQQINSSLICLLSIVTGQCFQLFSLILFSSENNVVSS